MNPDHQSPGFFIFEHMPDNILELSHVTKKYVNHIALNDLSLGIPGNAIFGLLGPNGAGKTSLIRIITMITAPDSGTVLFNGAKLDKEHLYQIGYLPEERGLYKKMEVGEQALYLARLKGLSRAEALKRLKYWFEKFEIQPWWKKKIEELSKGMAQKVQFITTILHEPSFIILDEPFTGFDPINAELIKNELLMLQKKGATIVLSTHRMESVEELCSHIALVNNARIILNGAVKEIQNNFRTNTYELNLKGSFDFKSRFNDSRFNVLSEVTDGYGVTTARLRINQGATSNDLLAMVMPVCLVHGLREIVPSMGDIFIQKVNESK